MRAFVALGLLAILSTSARAIELAGTTHIDYYPEGNASAACCDGVATYRLQYAPGNIHFSHFSILDHTNHPIWTATNFNSHNGNAGLLVEMIEDGGKDYLRLYNFPALETTINPDMGENAYTEFGYAFIELPPLSSVTVPEPLSIALIASLAVALALRHPRI